MKRFPRGKKLLVTAMVLLVGLLLVLTITSRRPAPFQVTGKLVSKKDCYKEGELIDIELVLSNQGKLPVVVFRDSALSFPCARSPQDPGLYFETLGTGLQRKPFINYDDFIVNCPIYLANYFVPPKGEGRETLSLDNFLVAPPPGKYRIPYTLTLHCSPKLTSEQFLFRLRWWERAGRVPLVGPYLQEYINPCGQAIVSEGELHLSVRPSQPGEPAKR
jgi:hypothetical protein